MQNFDVGELAEARVQRARKVVAAQPNLGQRRQSTQFSWQCARKLTDVGVQVNQFGHQTDLTRQPARESILIRDQASESRQ